MNETEVKVAGQATIHKLELYSIQAGNADGVARGESIKNLSHRIQISEDMNRGFLFGTVDVTDGTDIVSRLPITGNELLIFEHEDYYGLKATEAFFVFAISDFETVSDNDENLVKFKLHFCSREKFASDTVDIRRAFRGFIHEQAETIHAQYIEAFENSPVLRIEGIPFKGLQFDYTENDSVYAIPNMKPFQALNFLAKRAWSSERPAGVYKFWETRRALFFRSLEGTIQWFQGPYGFNNRIPSFFYSTAFQDLPDQGNIKMQQILSLGLNKSRNNIQTHKRGGFTSRVIELDIMNRTPIETRYDHVDEMTNNSNYTYRAGNAELSPALTTDNVNAFYQEGPEFLVIKDYPSVGTEMATVSTAEAQRAIRARQEYAENTVKHLAYGTALEENKIQVTVHGSFAIMAGGYINLQIPQFSGVSSDSENIVSGNWLVQSCEHVYDGNAYRCEIVATRPGDLNVPDSADIQTPGDETVFVTFGEPTVISTEDEAARLQAEEFSGIPQSQGFTREISGFREFVSNLFDRF